MLVIVIVAALVASTTLFIARPLLFASLDPDVAAAQGYSGPSARSRLHGAYFAVTMAEAMQAVGALLVFALLLLPAATAHRVAMRQVPFCGHGIGGCVRPRPDMDGAHNRFLFRTTLQRLYQHPSVLRLYCGCQIDRLVAKTDFQATW